MPDYLETVVDKFIFRVAADRLYNSEGVWVQAEGRRMRIGRPSRSLDEVLPYLAALPGVIAYNLQAQTLTFRRQPGFLTLYSDQVHIT
jgi:hypothetical protein